MSDTPQGPGWWQASDGKWYPPEQTPGGAPSAATGTVDIGGALSYGWNKFMQHVGVLIVGVLAIWIVNVVFSIISYPLSVNGNWILSYGVSAIGWVLSTLVSIGLVRMALAIVRGETPEMSMVSPSGPEVGIFLVAMIIYSIIATIGFALCIIPGIFVAALLGFTPFIAVEQRLSPVDCIKKSYEIARPQMGMLLAWTVVAFVINVIGACLCGVGLLVTIPLTTVGHAMIYKNLSGQTVAA